jgi:hypothetical protein
MRDAHGMHFQKKGGLFERAYSKSTSATFYGETCQMNIGQIILFVLAFLRVRLHGLGALEI